jgi:hypothetical protein
MSIYSSEQVLPYVYQGTHKDTGKIYIGSRTNKKQNLPSNLDLQNYKTSAPAIEETFHEFNWIILAEFFNPQDAWLHEQFLIYEQWQISKEQSLNQHHYHLKESFNTIGKSPSEYTLVKMREARKGKKLTKEHRDNIAKARLGKRYSLRKPKIITGRPHKGKRGPQNNPFVGERKQRPEELILTIALHRTKLFDFLTPDGFVISQISTKDCCVQFNLNIRNAHPKFSANGKYKGFVRL